MKDEKPKNHKPKKHPYTEIAETRDTISQYLLNPRGEIDGLLLSGGMFVKFPPHLSRELASLVKPQDEVVAVGWMEGPELMKGYAIINPEVTMALRDAKPPSHGHSDTVEPLKPFSVQGKVKHLRRDPRGRCHGAILDDGTILEFPAHAGETFVECARSNRAVYAAGFGTFNRHGTSVSVAMVGDSPETLAPIRPDLGELEKPKRHEALEEGGSPGSNLAELATTKEN